MRATELTISISRKVNLGNYESTDLFAALKVELESSDGQPEAVADSALNSLREIIRKAMTNLPERR